jgi:hypothetical protein
MDVDFFCFIYFPYLTHLITLSAWTGFTHLMYIAMLIFLSLLRFMVKIFGQPFVYLKQETTTCLWNLIDGRNLKLLCSVTLFCVTALNWTRHHPSYIFKYYLHVVSLTLPLPQLSWL